MKLSLKVISLGAILAAFAAAAPIEVEKRDASTDRIIACFVGLVLTGAWPGSCQAAVAVNTGLIRGIALNQLSMDFTPADPWKPTTSSSAVVATMLSIPGVTLPINSIRQHIILADNGVQLGSIETPWAAASVSGSTLTTSFPSSPLSVFSTSHAAFSSFVGSITTKATHPLTLQGSVDAKLNLGIFGSMTIPGIGFKTDVPLAGLNSLKTIKYIYLVDVNTDTLNELAMTVVINIVNPSKLTLSLGDIVLSTSAATGYIGTSTVKNLKLVPGDNYILSTSKFDLTLPATMDLLTTLSERDGPLQMVGFSGSSTDLALNPGLANLKSQLVIPQNFVGSAMSQIPTKNWSLKILPKTGTDFLIQMTATFQSPYYGYGVEMVNDNGRAASATIVGLSFQPRLFYFNNSLKFKTTGSGSTTVTFTAKLNGDALVPATRDGWQAVVDYGRQNGHLPVTFEWVAGVKVNNDGILRQVDWGSYATGEESVKIAVGADFAKILDFIPAA